MPSLDWKGIGGMRDVLPAAGKSSRARERATPGLGVAALVIGSALPYKELIAKEEPNVEPDAPLNDEPF